MEIEWMQSLTKDTKERFKSIRYMDDVMTLTARSPSFDTERFKADLHKSECYWEPLRLETGVKGLSLKHPSLSTPTVQ